MSKKIDQMVLAYMQNTKKTLNDIYQRAKKNIANMDLNQLNSMLKKHILNRDDFVSCIKQSSLEAMQKIELMKWYNEIWSFKEDMETGNISDPIPFLENFLYNDTVQHAETFLKNSQSTTTTKKLEDTKRPIGFQAQ